MSDEIEALRASESDGRVEVIDEVLGQWLVNIALVGEDDVPVANPSPSTAVVLGALAQQLPEVARIVGEARTLKVVFSPEIRKGLASGQYQLMRSAKETLPVAVDATGRIVGHPRVAGESVAAATGGVALGAAATALWPVVLAGAVAAAAAYSEQRWLERTFSELQDAVDRIERRLRDDDAGTLEAANALAELVKPGATAGYITPYLRLELAATRQEVERIYRSRRRFVERFKRALEEAQDAHEQKTGERVAWVDVADELRDRGTGVFDELVLFLQAMIVRGRITACAAAVVAADGDGQSALRMLDSFEPELRDDYYDLYRRVRALARNAPEDSLLGRVTNVVGKHLPLLRDNDEQGAAQMAWLEQAMVSTVGDRFERDEQELAVVVSADVIA